MSDLEESLISWVAEKATNGITQHSEQWLAEKSTTIGGSTLATLQGENPYETIYSMIMKRIGLQERQSSIYMQWGNLFEELIQKYIEHKTGAKIYGENIYVPGGPGIAYSPDGLSVMDVVTDDFDDEMPSTKTHVVLHEFKCPFQRIPYKTPPGTYITQLKMGLDVLKLPTIGLLSEAIFRRCSISDLGMNERYNKIPVAKSRGKKPLAFGYITFTAADPDKSGESANGAQEELVSSPPRIDYGECDPELLTEIFADYDAGRVVPHYSELYYDDSFEIEYPPGAIGILPWKLFHIEETWVYPEANYLEPWIGKIQQTMNFIKRCNSVDCLEERQKMYNQYVAICADEDFC